MTRKLVSKKKIVFDKYGTERNQKWMMGNEHMGIVLRELFLYYNGTTLSNFLILAL